MKNDVNQLKKEVKELRGYIEKIVDILEMSYENACDITDICNYLRDSLNEYVDSYWEKEGK